MVVRWILVDQLRNTRSVERRRILYPVLVYTSPIPFIITLLINIVSGYVFVEAVALVFVLYFANLVQLIALCVAILNQMVPSLDVALPTLTTPTTMWSKTVIINMHQMRHTMIFS